MLTKEVVLACVERCNKDNLAVELPVMLAKVEATRRCVIDCKTRLRQGQESWVRLQGAIERDLSAAQLDCLHPLTVYHADPAGGRDSWSECVVCGGEV